MPQPAPLSFTDADFGDEPTQPFTSEDFAEPLPKIDVSEYERQRQRTPMGPFGPLNPSEVLHLPDVFKAPAALLERSEILPKVQEAIGISLRSLGIDPALITPTPPGENPSAVPTPMEEAFPGLMKGLNLSADQAAAMVADPTLAPLLLAKPAQALFGLQGAAALPQSLQDIAQARTGEELGGALGAAGQNTLMALGLAHSIKDFVPLADRELNKITQEGVPDAIHSEAEGLVRNVQQPEVTGQGAGQVPAVGGGQEASARGGVLANQAPGQEVPQNAPVSLGPPGQGQIAQLSVGDQFLDSGREHLGPWRVTELTMDSTGKWPSLGEAVNLKTGQTMEISGMTNMRRVLQPQSTVPKDIQFALNQATKALEAGDLAGANGAINNAYGKLLDMPAGNDRAQVAIREVEQRVTAAANAPKQQVLLTPEETQHLDTAKSDIDVPVDVINEPLKEGDPFAGQIATIDRANNRIIINPGEYGMWMAQIPKARRAEAVKALLGEERIHLAVDDASALDYWNSLTSFEKAVSNRRYTGQWGGVGQSPTMMGHEALRFRLQQLSRLTPREIADAVGKERWTFPVITALESAVRKAREVLGTEASKTQQAIVGRMEENLKIARAAVGASPGAQRRPSDFEKELTQQRLDEARERLRLAGSDSERKAAQDEVDDLTDRLGPSGEEQAFPGAMRRKEWDPMEELKAKGWDSKWPFVPADLENRSFRDAISTDPSLSDAERSKILSFAPGGKNEIRVDMPPPAAMRRKGKGETSEQGFMYLPPAPKAEQFERDVFAKPNANAIEATANQHFDQSLTSGKAPSFEEFHNELKGQFGSGITRDSIWYSWHDAMVNRLIKAPGAEIDHLLDALELRGKLQKEQIAKTAQRKAGPEYFTKGTIPDSTDVPKEIQPEFARLAEQFAYRKPRTPAGTKYLMGPGVRKRYAAIGAIVDKLSAEAGAKPERSWHRTEIGPEDVGQKYTVTGELPRDVALDPEKMADLEAPDIERKRLFTQIPPELQKDPKFVSDLATRDAAVDATGKAAPPRTVTKNVMALRDKSGRVVLASTWRDPRSGPRVTEPGASNLPSRRIDASLLEDYTPLVVMTLREPVKDFRQVFHTEDAFNKWFGDIGVEGTPGLRGGTFVGPHADVANLGAGTRGTGPSRPPEAAPAGRFNAMDFEEPSGTELTAPEGRIVPRGTPLYRSPRPEPIPAERLSIAGRIEAERRAAEAFPVGGEIVAPEYGKSTGRVTEYGKPDKLQPGWPLRAGLEKTGNLPASKLGQRTPAAMRRNYEAAKEVVDVVAQDLKNSIKRGSVKRDIPMTLDVADNNTYAMALHAGERLKAISMEDLPSKATRKEKRAQAVEAQKLREAAIAYVAAGGDKARITDTQRARGARPSIPSFEEYLNRAEQRGKDWSGHPNPLKAWQGRKDLAYVEKLRAGLEYAKEHWDDPKFQEFAKAYNDQMKEQIDFERSHGREVESRENYIPGVYEGDFWDDSSMRFMGRGRLIGQDYGKRKTFTNPYQAISVGPFRMANLDLAKLAESRIQSGARKIENDIWFRSLKKVYDPINNDPVAKDPAVYKVVDQETGQEISKWKSPSLDYELVTPSLNARPMAIHKAYADLVKTAVMPSFIDQLRIGDFKVGRMAIESNQILKHAALLLWDTFHFGRLAQYAAAISGRKVGWRGGYSALTYAGKDLDLAVRKGLISQAAADWAKEPVRIGKDTIATRQEVFNALKGKGLNIYKSADLMHRNAIDSIPLIGGLYAKGVTPYNDLMFGKFLPGLIAETAVNKLQEMALKHPNLSLSALTRDVAFDMNTFFGNMGRQGIFRSRGMQQLGQIAFLAPGWQEALFQKEIRAAARTIGAGARMAGLDIPYRKGLPAMGALGTGVWKGLLSYFAFTQAVNLLTRGKTTFQNPEPGHKLDAWFPLPGGQGFWLSPLATFAEVTHDIIRLVESKDRVYEAIQQIGENRLSPIGKMGMIAATGYSPAGQKYASTPRMALGMAQQVIPFVPGGANPITATAPLSAISHAIAPNLVSPPRPGAVWRSAIGTVSGTKVEVAKTPVQEMFEIARNFVDDNDLRKDTGFEQIQTDDPSYSKMRTALANDDIKVARQQLAEVKKNRNFGQIEQAMKSWARRPWTGSLQNEALLRASMTKAQLETYNQANQDRMDILLKFYNLLTE